MLQVVLVPSSTNTVNTINTQLTTVGGSDASFRRRRYSARRTDVPYICIYVVYIYVVYTHAYHSFTFILHLEECALLPSSSVELLAWCRTYLDSAGTHQPEAAATHQQKLRARI